MSVCVMIPARDGSQGIPGKNIKLLAGKPLIQYTIDAAIGNFSADEIIVSTDSEDIKMVVEELGISVPKLRPSHLAQNDTPTAAVIEYELKRYKEFNGTYPDHMILLQVTSPFRNAAHLKEAWANYQTNQSEMLVSVSASKQNPYYNLFEEEHGILKKSKSGNYTRRQDCPVVWELNGAIYIFRTDRFLEVGIEGMNKIKYEMSEQDSIDIDTPFDWEMAETLLNR